jgi:hypothetical protein
MKSMSEITIILKDSERTYRQKFLIYNTEYCVNDHDETILNCIIEAKKNFQGNPESVKVKIHLEIQ